MLEAALLAVAVQAPLLPDDPAVAPETLDAVLEHVLPSAEEELWRAIPWRPTLWDGVRDGYAERKPVLLWAMNGHPLGCT